MNGWIFRIKKMWSNMNKQASEIRKEAKDLQRRLQSVTDPEEKKLLARQMNDLFAQAARLRKEAKLQHYQEESIEREFLSLKANLE
jgi:vacuolar-type H+-ATPase subunit I/STV1